jgi:hypothetical protein
MYILRFHVHRYYYCLGVIEHRSFEVCLTVVALDNGIVIDSLFYQTEQHATERQ